MANPLENLVAGRELDALVAEQVMGLRLSTVSAHELPGQRFYFPNDDDDDTSWVPSYSTSIAAAWQVVEKLRECGGLSDVFIRYNSEDKCWAVGWVGCGDHGEDYYHELEQADTAPLAICLAALKAVGHE